MNRTFAAAVLLSALVTGANAQSVPRWDRGAIDLYMNSITSDGAPGIWAVKDSNGASILYLAKPMNNARVKAMVDSLNAAKGDNPKMAYLKTECGTVFVKVIDSDLLTERMGTTGAESYLAAATYSFTSLQGIARVHFDFEEGDHASPGTYMRLNFFHFWPIWHEPK